MNNTTILIVDDEEDILEFVGYNLRNEGYNVITTNNGLSAIEIAKKNKPDLIILDVMMPEMDGITTCEKMRTISSLNNTIITFLTARSEDYSQIAGFESGADDYITKPIRRKVLVSRVKALLRRRLNNEVMESLSFGNLSINKEKHKVVYRGENIILAKKEFKLLELLVSMPGKVFTRQEIFEKVWGPDLIIGDRTIDVHIRKIREKLNPDYIKTVKGIGYKFEH